MGLKKAGSSFGNTDMYLFLKFALFSLVLTSLKPKGVTAVHRGIFFLKALHLGVYLKSGRTVVNVFSFLGIQAT